MSGAPENLNLNSLDVAGNREDARFPALSGDDADPQASVLAKTFEQIVQEALAQPGFLGVLLATLEADQTLKVRVAAGLMDPQRFQEMALKAGVSSLSAERLPLPEDSEQPFFAGRLQGQHPHNTEPILTDRLHDLFEPGLNAQAAKAIQEAAGVAQIGALPAFVEGKVAGVLLAASATPFSQNDLRLLHALARQAGAAMLSQRFGSDVDAITQIVGALQTDSTDEETILDRSVSALVNALNYPAALIATVEDGTTLLLRACAAGGSEAVREELAPKLRDLLQREPILGRLDEPEHCHNLGVCALQDATETHFAPLESDRLSDLLHPHVSEEDAARIQRSCHVRSVLAVPFALPDEVTGALLIMSHRTAFPQRERRLLTAIAQQAALGIRNARLYWRVEEQRRVAQTFARMAFSASAYLHTLRNRIGSFRTYLGLVQVLPHLDPRQQKEIIATGRKAYQSLDEAAEILDHLHEPWQQHPDVPTAVNDCLKTAMLKVFPRLQIKESRNSSDVNGGITVHWSLAEGLPAIRTSPDMLSEAFRIVIRNAADALEEKRNTGQATSGGLWIKSEAPEENWVRVTVRDDGVGIAPRNLRRIFELGWSTKRGQGMGFGLFWARNFVEGLGGSIEVESVPQQGASFRFVLPVGEEE